MRDYEVGGPTPVLLTGAPRVLASFALLAVTLAMVVPIYGGWLAGGAEHVFRFGVPLVWAVAAVRAGRSARLRALLLCSRVAALDRCRGPW